MFLQWFLRLFPNGSKWRFRCEDVFEQAGHWSPQYSFSLQDAYLDKGTPFRQSVLALLALSETAMEPSQTALQEASSSMISPFVVGVVEHGC